MITEHPPKPTWSDPLGSSEWERGYVDGWYECERYYAALGRLREPLPPPPDEEEP